jgi:drug/metabolite transporter (DMT)-like permease
VQKRRLPTSVSIWKHFAVMGLTFNALPFVLLSWAQLHIDSALAAIVNGTTPLFTVILAHLLTSDDRLSPAKLGGVLLGFAGLVVLVAPALVGGVQATVWGLLASIAAAASYGLATVYSRQHLRGLPSLVAPTAQLTMAALYLVPLSLLLERPYLAPLPGWPAIIALLLLTLLSTALPFVIFYRLVEKTSATNLSLVTYMVPVVATILGIVVLHERPDWNVYLSLALIVSGVMTVNGVFRAIGGYRLVNAIAKS